jgi:hypothetical protein
MLFCIVQKITILSVACLSNICYHTLIQDPVLNDTSVASASQIRVFAMLLLLIVGS